MVTINSGNPTTIGLAANEQLTVAFLTGAVGRVTRMGDKSGEPDQEFIPAAAGDTKIIGPFSVFTWHRISVTSGSYSYTQGQLAQFPYATHLGIVEAFTGNRTLRFSDNGRILRCTDGSGAEITVPADLPEGFNVGVAQWGAGAVTFTAGSGATKRSSTSGISAQYGIASILVAANATGAAAEFVLGGDVS